MSESTRTARRAAVPWLAAMGLLALALPALAADRPIEARELNFRLDALPNAWTTTPAPAGVAASYYAIRPDVGAELILLATPVGLERQHKPDRVAEDFLADVATIRRETIRRTPATAGGLVGLKVTAEIAVDGRPASFCGWFTAVGGIEYRLTCIDPRPGAFAEQSVDAILPRFALLDPKWQRRVADLPVPEPFQSPAYKYRVTLPRGWSRDPAMAAKYPLPEYVATRGRSMVFGVIPAIVGTAPTRKPSPAPSAPR